MPSSAMTTTASGRTWVASVPALNASNVPSPWWRRKASAIWLRALLWVQTKRTRRGCMPAAYAPTVKPVSRAAPVAEGTARQGGRARR